MPNHSNSSNSDKSERESAAPAVSSLLQPQPHTVAPAYASDPNNDNQSDPNTASPSMPTTSLPIAPLLTEKNESAQTSTTYSLQPLSATTNEQTHLNGADLEYSNKSINDMMSTSKAHGDNNSNGTYVDIDMIQIKQAAQQFGEPSPLPSNDGHDDNNNTDKPKGSRAESAYVHPEEKANWISYLLLTWLNPIINKGFKQTIKLGDTLPMRSDMTAEYLTQCFQREWDAEIEKKGTENASIAYALLRAFGWHFWIAGMCQCVGNGIGFITPNLLNWLITFIAEASVLPPSLQQPEWYGYMLAVGMFLCAMVTILL